AHFDGIDNTGNGDKAHSFDATTEWQDLKNPTFKLPRSTGAGQWLSNGFQPLDDDTSFYSSFFPDTYPSGNESRTVEVIFRTPDAAHMFSQEDNVQRNIFVYGTYEEKKPFGVLYRGKTRSECTSDGGWIFYPISGNQNNLITCLASTPSLTTPNTINTVTSTYANSIQNANTNSYINNSQVQIAVRQGSDLNTDPNGFIYIGEANLKYSTFLSVRLYNRVLEPQEIEDNAALDQIRFLAPPIVTVDGNPCTNVTVLSPRIITCLAPAGTSGTVDVEVRSGDNATRILWLEDEFTYQYRTE
ncbi:MAG: IPT/TIG domain-containing protein, partial [Prevotellaceae bacterium]|nr:IPT/TIG domain-containing protein [Prevotellaceae bacterium]